MVGWLVGWKAAAVLWAWHGVKELRQRCQLMCAVLQAVKQKGDALRHASEELQNKPEIVLEVCVGREEHSLVAIGAV